jgi:hypothetical protein
MKGDFTRFTHDPSKHYTRVLRQQGRVDLDADWNEAMDLQAHHLQTRTLDIVGPSGVPADSPGFGVTYRTTNGAPDLALSPGRLYVEGLLASLEAEASYLHQPDLPVPPPLVPTRQARHLVYALVWERHVTVHVDTDLQEKALDGLDTTTRTRTMAQVRWMPAPDHCDAASEAWDRMARRTGVGLHSRVAPAAAVATPCDVQPRRGYRGMENRLYRVEVHDDGLPYPATGAESVPATLAQGSTFHVAAIGRPWQPGDAIELFRSGGGASILTYVRRAEGGTVTVEAQVEAPVDSARRVATYKWSRDNGSVVLAVTGFPQGLSQSVAVARFGRDHVLGLRPGDWVEVVSDETETALGPGTMARVVEVHEDDLRIDLDRDVSHHRGQQSVRLRRWDGPEGLRAIRADPDDATMTWLDLEDGVQVRFRADGQPVRSGDWWAFTARHAGVSDDPGEVQDLRGAPPQGRWHLARLAIVDWGEQVGSGWDPKIHDCRRRFLPLTRLEAPCAHTSVGNGTTSVGRHVHNATYPHGIQQAIDSLPAGVVRILPGTYDLVEPLRLHDGITLQGCGDRSVLRAPAGRPAITAVGVGAAVADVAVETLRVEANGGGGVVWLETAERARLQGCTLLGGVGPALAARDARQVRVAGCRVEGAPAVHVQAEDFTVEGSRVRGPLRIARSSQRVLVEGCQLGGAPGHAVELGVAHPAASVGSPPVPDAPPSAIRIEGSRIEAAGQCAVRAVSAASGPHGLTIQDNRITGCWAQGDPPPASGAVHVEGWARVRVAGNHVAENARAAPGDGAAGLRFASCQDVDVAGNHVAKNGAEGLAPALVAAGCDRLAASHNHLHGWGRIAGKAAAAPARVAVVLDGRGLRLHANRVRGGGIQVTGTSAGVDVESNHVCDAAGPGIHLGDGARVGVGSDPGAPRPVMAEVAVRHNRIERMRGNGIEAVAPSAGLAIEGNRVHDCAEEDHDPLLLAGIAAVDATGLRVAANQVGRLGEHLGSETLAGISVADSTGVRTEGNEVHSQGVGLRATNVQDLLAEGDACTAPVALAVRGVRVRVRGGRFTGRLHVREGSVGVEVEDNLVEGTIRVGGLLQAVDGNGHAVGAHAVTVRGNRVSGGPEAGIETCGLANEGATGGVHGLSVVGNEVTGCCMEPKLDLAAWPIAEFAVMYEPSLSRGAIHLDGVHGARVHGNRIRGNGGHALRTRACMGLDVQGNQADGNGRMPGADGGFLLGGCLPVAGSAGDEGAALVVLGNQVVVARGRALQADGMGRATVQGNTFTSQGRSREGEGSCIALDFPDTDPLRGLFLPALDLPGRRLEAHHHLEHHGYRDEPGDSFAGVGLAPARARGRLTFCGNQVEQADGRDTGSTVSIVAGGDLAFQGNQVATSCPGGAVRAAVRLYAPTLRATGNGIEETPWGATWSAFAVAHRPILASNHLTHCHHPASAAGGVVEDNLVQIGLKCQGKRRLEPTPDEKEMLGFPDGVAIRWREVATDLHQATRERLGRLEAAAAALASPPADGLAEPERLRLAQRLMDLGAGTADLVDTLSRTVDRCRWMEPAARGVQGENDGWVVVGRIQVEGDAGKRWRVRLVRSNGDTHAEEGFEATVDRNGDFQMQPGGEPEGTYELRVLHVDRQGAHVVHTTRLGLKAKAGRRDVVEIAARRAG